MPTCLICVVIVRCGLSAYTVPACSHSVCVSVGTSVHGVDLFPMLSDTCCAVCLRCTHFLLVAQSSVCFCYNFSSKTSAVSCVLLAMSGGVSMALMAKADIAHTQIYC